jgi:probable phosphomutase (TIGR03848 family)
MTKFIVVRHARSTANAQGILAGRMPNVHLDEIGLKQAQELGENLAGIPVHRVIASPLERTHETIQPLASVNSWVVSVEDAFNECDYGDWSGRLLVELSDEPLWKVIQNNPSLVTFPQGESMTDVYQRATNRLKTLADEYRDETIMIVSHGDVIKMMMAFALSMPLDSFQRLHVQPASFSLFEMNENQGVIHAFNTNSFDQVRSFAGETSTSTLGGGDHAPRI